MNLKVTYFLMLFVASLTINASANAIDLGVWGESSAIAEEDFEVHIIKQLEALGDEKLRAHQEMIKDQMVARIKRPRAVKNISKATATTARYYDPTFIIQDDIFNEKNQLLYPRGTKVNPLKQKAFDEIWIFIDGDDLLQVEFAKNYQEANAQNELDKKSKVSKANETKKPTKIKKIILTNGEPGAQTDGSFFFFDQAGEISRKLNLTKVPSVIRQAPNEAMILIEEIALEDLEDLNDTQNIDTKDQEEEEVR